MWNICSVSQFTPLLQGSLEKCCVDIKKAVFSYSCHETLFIVSLVVIKKIGAVDVIDDFSLDFIIKCQL